jgi:hypothetical protein
MKPLLLVLWERVGLACTANPIFGGMVLVALLGARASPLTAEASSLLIAWEYLVCSHLSLGKHAWRGTPWAALLLTVLVAGPCHPTTDQGSTLLLSQMQLLQYAVYVGFTCVNSPARSEHSLVVFKLWTRAWSRVAPLLGCFASAAAAVVTCVEPATECMAPLLGCCASAAAAVVTCVEPATECIAWAWAGIVACLASAASWLRRHVGPSLLGLCVIAALDVCWIRGSEDARRRLAPAGAAAQNVILFAWLHGTATVACDVLVRDWSAQAVRAAIEVMAAVGPVPPIVAAASQDTGYVAGGGDAREPGAGMPQVLALVVSHTASTTLPSVPPPGASPSFHAPSADTQGVQALLQRGASTRTASATCIQVAEVGAEAVGLDADAVPPEAEVVSTEAAAVRTEAAAVRAEAPTVRAEAEGVPTLAAAMPMSNKEKQRRALRSDMWDAFWNGLTYASCREQCNRTCMLEWAESKPCTRNCVLDWAATLVIVIVTLADKSEDDNHWLAFPADDADWQAFRRVAVMKDVREAALAAEKGLAPSLGPRSVANGVERVCMTL